MVVTSAGAALALQSKIGYRKSTIENRLSAIKNLLSKIDNRKSKINNLYLNRQSAIKNRLSKIEAMMVYSRVYFLGLCSALLCASLELTQGNFKAYTAHQQGILSVHAGSISLALLFKFSICKLRFYSSFLFLCSVFVFET